ncbi:MAG: DAK2 domain-containing protein [Candidatus Limnocylindrales bacterium]
MNALNVYPVPDGDTGTNMLHTMKTALQHAQGSADRGAAAVAAAAAHGALMGARGNSGVILSQILRGLKDALAAGEVDLRSAFAKGSAHAMAAVTAPAPGTILTALAEIEAVVRRGGSAAAEVLEVAVDAGRGAVDRTRNENPTNRAAGVVDAGARGLWILLDGALESVRPGGERVISGPAVTSDPIKGRSLGSAHENVSGAGSVPAVASWAGAYDVQLLITGPTRSVAELRDEMLEFGADCVLVVGDESVCKIHVHTLYPDKIIGIAVTAGRISDVVVEDLELMSAEHEAATGIVMPSPVAKSGRTAAVGVVAVVPAEGLASVVTSLGGHPLRGGASMNPSTEELLAAIDAAEAAHVIVLPNDKNVILAARSAASLAVCQVTVLPVTNLGAGMAALLAFEAGQPADEVIAAMTEAAERAHAIEITRATRSVTVDGVSVRESETIGLVDGKVVAHGDDEAAVLGDAAGRLGSIGIFTLYLGAGVNEARAAAACAALARAFPEAEIEVVDGGQPHYPFVVAAE